MKPVRLFLKVSSLLSLALILFIAQGMAKKADLPKWAETYGSDTPFSEHTHLTGFGMSTIEDSEEDALGEAKDLATSDLIRKVSVTVKSKIRSALKERGNQVSSNYKSVTESVTRLKIQGIDFKITQEDNKIYTLAYLPRKEASSRYFNEASRTLEKIRSTRKQAESYDKADKRNEALKAYLDLSSLYSTYYRQYSLTQYLRSSASKAFDELEEETGNGSTGDTLVNPTRVVQWEQETERRINKLLKAPTSTLEQAIDLLIRKFEWQDLTIHKNKVKDLQYQDSDFSSAFGNYTARKLERKMSTALPRGTTATVTRGQYWDLGEKVEISARITTEDGRERAAAQTKVPKSAIPEKLELEPRNVKQALREQEALADNKMVDGGINVEVRSDKEKDDNSVVLEKGEEINFYFRVNQPSYLRLTYILANGKKVMLWDSYYIGADRVNEWVSFPKTFVVAPPLGVERLVVTAYSENPPDPQTVTQIMDGVEYQVVPDDLSEVMNKTRGLKVKNEKMRVGVSSLAITTIPKKQ